MTNFNYPYQRGAKKILSRKDRRKKLRAWAQMAFALLKARGGDPSKYTEGQLALMFYRRRQKPIEQITRERFAPQARASLLKSLSQQGGQ
jgi:hypothetical protein